METTVTNPTPSKNARHLAILTRLSEQGQLSEEVARSVDKFLTYEAAGRECAKKLTLLTEDKA